jgi:uncharacterized protein YbjT (DUF2867 family)
MMKAHGKSALILGATGLTGSHLLDLLVNHIGYTIIKTPGRRAPEIKHPKIHFQQIDLEQNLVNHPELFDVDEVFVCIGTTQKKTPDKAAYRNIDYGIPLQAAKMAKKAGIQTFQVISALGADTGSRVFYNRLKGEMERDVMGVGIPFTYFLRPALIVGNRQEFRLGEGLAKSFFQLINPMIPEAYRSIDAHDIACAMVYLTNGGQSTSSVIPSDQIRRLAKQM